VYEFKKSTFSPYEPEEFQLELRAIEKSVGQALIITQAWLVRLEIRTAADKFFGG
jgi:hypothetical protein